MSSSTLGSSAVGSSTSTTPATSTSGEAQSTGARDEISPLPTPRPQRPGANPTKRYTLNVSALGYTAKVEARVSCRSCMGDAGIDNAPTSVSGVLAWSVADKIQGMSTSSSSQLSVNPSSLLAPRVLSVSEGSWVCSRGATDNRLLITPGTPTSIVDFRTNWRLNSPTTGRNPDFEPSPRAIPPYCLACL